MVLRFAIGNPPAELELEIQQEEDASGPFLRIPGKARLLSGLSLVQEYARQTAEPRARAGSRHVQDAHIQDSGVLGGGCPAFQRAVRH